MANKPISIVMIKEIIRLKQSGFSNRKISESLSTSRTTIIKYLKQIEAIGFSFEELLRLDESDLYDLFGNKDPQEKDLRYPALLNFFPYIEKEIKKVGVTRWLLWAEYKQRYPGGYSYSQFCYHYQQFCKHKEAWMHMDHKAGDKMFVDFAGKKLQVVDKNTGEIKDIEVLVSILGASQMTYVEACSDQSSESFISSVENSLRYFGGVPKAIVPDNLKSAVTKSSKYEPLVNERFLDFARHYNTAILPTRARKPKDKALVEGAVKIVYHRIYALIRNQVFFSIADLNKTIREILEQYNSVLFQGKEYSRRDLFEEIEKPVLKALPVAGYQMKTYKLAKVQKNCHVYLKEDYHYYSVPFRFIGKNIKIAYSKSTVEIYNNYQRIAFHKRDYKKYFYTTIKDHMPSQHQFVMDWNSEKFINWAKNIGTDTEEFIKEIFRRKAHPEQGYKSCLGILNFKAKVGKERLNRACKRALYYQSISYYAIKNILEKQLDKIEIPGIVHQYSIPFHENIRGNEYYQ